MKWLLQRFNLPLAFVTAIFVVAFGGLAVQASADSYTMYWEPDAANDLKDIFNDGEKDTDLEDLMYVVALGGLFGSDGVKFSFTADINNQMNNQSGDDVSDNYYAVTTVYCKDNDVTTTAPTARPYEKIDYAIGFHADSWNDVEDNATQEMYAGITKITKIGTLGEADDQVFKKDEIDNATKLGDENDGNGDDSEGGKAKDHISTACYDALKRGHLSTDLRNYYKLSAADKTAVDEFVNREGAAAPAGGEAAGAGTNCAGGGLGWLFCPLIEAMAKTVQVAGGLIEELMTVRFLAERGPQAELQQAWRAFLTIANLMLVIAFLFIIFSQSTGAGLSNYGIKRMLPRLVIAAILMNLSFFICAAMIDLSNIVGSSIMGFLVGDNSISSSLRDATGGDGNFLSGALAGLAIVAFAVMIFIPVVLSIIAIFVILVARQVILMILVLVSPLAFAAWLLPNTEQYFKKWYGLFFQLLILFPMIMTLFGAALFMANLIGNQNIGSDIF